MRISRAAVTVAPAEWFTGDAWIEPIVAPDGRSRTQVDSVRFAPGARTVWHRHPLGQTLVVTAGSGRVQRRGGPVENVGAGDTVHIDAGEWHWHGAAPAAPMTHLAIEEIAADGSGTEAGGPVGDAEYLDGGADVLPIDRVILLDQALTPARATERVEIRRITLAPGVEGGLHVHNGPVFGSIETGSVVYGIEGEPESVLRPGDTFYEPEGVRIARFDALAEGVTFLGYFLLDHGEVPEITFPA
ncbi:cupin domain-containing protein [Nocardia sp. alder85J]|uniref:(R)-mandelonitrile lyase n=1 Tax=Nocardia sp. alder85J TaxID=2862949 RepID=UPI001CD456AE|nr:cupin domain-containing protein [Nocardia sp. alder85J]MCX4092298.1 cupin domain-containing protein [Nocardia sp. alder85J]